MEEYGKEDNDCGRAAYVTAGVTPSNQLHDRAPRQVPYSNVL